MAIAVERREISICRITVKTTVVCFLKRLDVNVEHMSGTVGSNVKGHGASSSKDAPALPGDTCVIELDRQKKQSGAEV